MDHVSRIKNDKGNVTIIALMILVVLTLLGISASRTSTIDMQIARNQMNYKQNFYLAEGGQNREAAEIGSGSYSVTNIEATDSELATEADGSHQVLGKDYDYTVEYKGYYPPPSGYSVIHFNRYDYAVDTWAGERNVDLKIASRYYKIGPKAD